ncbi:MAG: hypothetical protein ABIH37_05785 [archaeon]
MEQEITNKEILEQLKQIRLDVNIIKENMIDIDCILTPKEEARHEESLAELERGETISHSELKKELGL